MVVCEGGTEKRYIDQLVADFGSNLVDVEAVGQVGVPETVVARAIERQQGLTRSSRKETSSSFDKLFTVWAVFDKDDFEVAQPKATAAAHGVRVAFTNPCFELWGLLHLEEWRAPCDRKEIQRRLRERMPSYDHDKHPYFDYSVLTPDARASAMMRAKTLREERLAEEDPEGSPFTSVHDLVQHIGEAAGQLQTVSQALEAVEADIRRAEEARSVDGTTDFAALSRLYSARKALLGGEA